jgi:hypothetical protein
MVNGYETRRDGWRGVLRDRRVLVIGGICLLAGFMLGFGVQYGMTLSHRSEAETTQHSLTFHRLEATLGAATVEVQRGNHEVARQLASRFFTELQDNIDDAPAGSRAAFDEILARRDPLITSLSRADPQSAELLAQVFFSYRTALGESGLP